MKSGAVGSPDRDIKTAAAKPRGRRLATTRRGQVIVENVNHPGQMSRVNASKYEAARAALLVVLPKRAPGMTQHQMMLAMRDALCMEQFPGTTTTWWTKTVQLDLEAKGLVVREPTKPARWRRA